MTGGDGRIGGTRWATHAAGGGEVTAPDVDQDAADDVVSDVEDDGDRRA